MEKLLSSHLQCIITVETVFDWMSMLKGNQPKKKIVSWLYVVRKEQKKLQIYIQEISSKL